MYLNGMQLVDLSIVTRMQRLHQANDKVWSTYAQQYIYIKRQEQEVVYIKKESTQLTQDDLQKLLPHNHSYKCTRMER